MDRRLPIAGLAALLVCTSACGDEPVLQSDAPPGAGVHAARSGKKKVEDLPPAEVPPPVEYAWYQLETSDEGDPLWRLGLSDELASLRSDPSAAGWGSDYWGYWSEPFPRGEASVTYVIGLTRTTYAFAALPGGRLDVERTTVVQPYPSGTPTTTVVHVGTFAPSGAE